MTDELKAASVSLPRRLWRSWRGRTGDEAIVLLGLLALSAHVLEEKGFDPLSVAVLTVLLILGRNLDRDSPQ